MYKYGQGVEGFPTPTTGSDHTGAAVAKASRVLFARSSDARCSSGSQHQQHQGHITTERDDSSPLDLAQQNKDCLQPCLSDLSKEDLQELWNFTQAFPCFQNYQPADQVSGCESEVQQQQLSYLAQLLQDKGHALQDDIIDANQGPAAANADARAAYSHVSGSLALAGSRVSCTAGLAAQHLGEAAHMTGPISKRDHVGEAARAAGPAYPHSGSMTPARPLGRPNMTLPEPMIMVPSRGHDDSMCISLQSHGRKFSPGQGRGQGQGQTVGANGKACTVSLGTVLPFNTLKGTTVEGDLAELNTRIQATCLVSSKTAVALPVYSEGGRPQQSSHSKGDLVGQSQRVGSVEAAIKDELGIEQE
ncbi:hypothetical protein WJX82_008513 [Trebouxia sp. C0006]